MTQPPSQRGPLPRHIYVRRRVTVLIVLVAIIAIIAAIFWPRGESTEPGDQDGPDASSSQDGPVIGDETIDPTGVPGAQDGDACIPGRVSITANTDEQEYASGESVEIWLTLQNNTAHDCVMDVSPAVQWYQITSPSGDGNEVYWTSTDCQELSETASPPQLLEAGVPISTPPITWDRRRSVAGECDADAIAARPVVGSGGASFDLVVRVGDLESEPRRFFLY